MIDWGYRAQRLGHARSASSAARRRGVHPPRPAGAGGARAGDSSRQQEDAGRPAEAHGARACSTRGPQLRAIIRDPRAHHERLGGGVLLPGCGSSACSHRSARDAAMLWHVGYRPCCHRATSAAAIRSAFRPVRPGAEDHYDNRVLFHRVANTLKLLDIPHRGRQCGTATNSCGTTARGDFSRQPHRGTSTICCSRRACASRADGAALTCTTTRAIADEDARPAHGRQVLMNATQRPRREERPLLRESARSRISRRTSPRRCATASTGNGERRRPPAP